MNKIAIYFKVFSMEKMKLKILAISDTHLGEDVSLLTYPHGRQHLWRELRTLFGYDLNPSDQIEIDELIMIGDITDRALSSTAQIMDATTNFVEMLGSVAKIKKGVYVLGNHDHTLWTDYFQSKYGGDYKCTPPDGEPILAKGSPISSEISEKLAVLLAVFFGYEYGSSWQKIEKEKNFDFVIANPLYSIQFGDRTYVFTHGSHFKNWVIDSVAINALQWLSLFAIKPFVDIDVKPCDAKKCASLDELEAEVGPFLDSLWVSSKNIPTGKSDCYWYILKTLTGLLEIGRPTPADSRLFSYEDLKNDLAKDRIKKLEGQEINRWRDYFLPHMLGYLSKNGRKPGNLTFVYGDTHIGGWEEFSHNLDGLNSPIRVYNTGGWTTHKMDDHPACHIFAVDISGNEYMLDISFNKVMVGDEELIKIAGQDAENNNVLLGNRLGNSKIANKIAVSLKKMLTPNSAGGAPSGCPIFKQP